MGPHKNSNLEIELPLGLTRILFQDPLRVSGIQVDYFWVILTAIS